MPSRRNAKPHSMDICPWINNKQLFSSGLRGERAPTFKLTMSNNMMQFTARVGRVGQILDSGFKIKRVLGTGERRGRIHTFGKKP